MGNIFNNSHKSALVTANKCYVSFSNYIFDLKTMAPITKLQIEELLFNVSKLQSKLNSFEVKNASEYEKIENIHNELENTKKSIHKYDPKWGKQERLDYAAILARSNVISDICAYLESLLNKTQANWSRPCMNTFLVNQHKFIILIIYV